MRYAMRQLEHGSRIVRADEQVAQARQDLAEEIARLLRAPQPGAVVDVEGHGHARRLRLGDRAAHDLADIVPERGGHPGEVDERVAPIVEDADRARRHAVLDEVQAHALTRTPQHSAAVHAVARQLADGAVAPRVLGGQYRDERGAQPEPGTGRGHVGLGAADLDVQVLGLLESLGRAGGQPQHHLAEPDQIVPRRGPAHAVPVTRTLRVVPYRSTD